MQMNIPSAHTVKMAEEESSLRGSEEPLDARVIPIKPDAVSLRARARQIIDEYDQVLQRLVEMVGKPP